MSQQTFSVDQASMNKPIANVEEVWQIYDTVLIGGLWSLTPNTGYVPTYAALGGNSEISFFNMRNRSHGLPYNNQDNRDHLAYVMHIYSVGVAFFAPSTSCYQTVDAQTLTTEETSPNCLFKSEIPKHTSVILRTNQDERLLTNSLMAPPGYGPVGGGVAAGDLEAVHSNPNVYHASVSQGESYLVNRWGFHKPLQIPRTANLSVIIRFSAYAQNLMQQWGGPMMQPMRAVANDGDYYGLWGTSGIQVSVQGKREVQQRGQYHA